MSQTVTLASVQTAQQIVLSHVKPGPITRIPIADALHRVLAEPIRCDMDYPPFDKAMMDGYAVRSSDLSAAGDEAPGKPRQLHLVGQIAAGHDPTGTVELGQAMQINTGAPLPPGTDTVVRVEDTERSADGLTVSVKVDVPLGTHVDLRGKYVTAGSTVIDAGERMGPGRVAVAAAAGAAELTVYRQPRVAILVTGDELVDVSSRPNGARIRNSNGYMMDALVRSCYADPVHLGVVGDDRKALTENVERGLDADMLCISGGISMGRFDFVPDILTKCGVRVLVHKMAMKPGKPTIFGVADSGTCVFGLPGNPIGCFVGFWILVRGALQAREGRQECLPTGPSARLFGSCKATADRQTYTPARITIDGVGELCAESLSWHGSGDPFGFCRANGLIVRRPHAPAAATGENVWVILLEQL